MLVSLGALGGVLVVLAAMAVGSQMAIVPSMGQTVWAEIKWPYPTVPWEASRAFTCTGAACGGAATLLVQAKIGFCNCATGVADDEELERVGELLLLGTGATPMKPGRPIAVGTMKGRSRPYALNGARAVVAPSGPLSALLIAYNDRCDVVVATALSGAASATDLEPVVLGFLGSDIIMRWVELKLGL